MSTLNYIQLFSLFIIIFSFVVYYKYSINEVGEQRSISYTWVVLEKTDKFKFRLSLFGIGIPLLSFVYYQESIHWYFLYSSIGLCLIGVFANITKPIIKVPHMFFAITSIISLFIGLWVYSNLWYYTGIMLLALIYLPLKKKHPITATEVAALLFGITGLINLILLW